ncbi:MAG: beta-ketoacyl-[acyl-carrier-protein] synthase family protein [Colwellia sp.]
MKTPLYISDFSLINALGRDNETIKKNLLLGNNEGLVRVDNLLFDDEITVGAVQGELPCVNNYPVHLQSRNNQLALLALNNMREATNNIINKFGQNRVAVIIGTSTSGISEGESAMKILQRDGQLPLHYDYHQQELFNTAEFISEVLGTTGVCLTISTACSSSAKAFKTASEMIDSGIADAAIVGGVDTLCEMTINGFYSLNSTAKGNCQPSSINRDGINIGEAAALALITKEKSDVKLLAVGESSDAYHMSAPQPEGEGAISAMQAALNEANLEATDIDYINLHGTATPKNDEMEATAIHSLFGSNIPCSSTKSLTGHTLGAAGATEVGLTWLLLSNTSKEDCYPPHIFDGEIDATIPQIKLVAKNDNISNPINTCLSNSFAFGGNNVSVIIGK